MMSTTKTKRLGTWVAVLALAIGSASAVSAAEKPKQQRGKTMNKRVAKQEAFIRVREVTTVCAAAPHWNSMTPELKQKYFMPYWSEARMRRHLMMLKAFGFNSIQITEAGQVARESGVSQEAWRAKLIQYCRLARELDMGVAKFVWGSSFYDATKGVYINDLDWHVADDRKRIEQFYQIEASFAPYVTRLITHWLDPGGPQCKDCTNDTMVEMHNAIMAAFRAKNPKIRGAINTWWMQPDRWPGYEGPEKLAAHPKLDKATDITGWRGSKYGRRGAVWAWYTADNEIQPALWVRMSVLEETFPHNLSPKQRRELAPQWTEGLAWYSIDDTCHGLNMQNLYVAGKLMQDPTLDAQKLLDEFVRGFVGKANAPAVAAALRAVERARTLSKSYTAREVMDAVEPPIGGQTSGATPATTWLDNTAVIVDSAIAGMKTVKIAPNFKTAWPVTLEPAEYIVELNAHLEAIRQMLVFQKAVRDVEKLQASGASVEELALAISALPQVINDPAHTAGLESELYKIRLSALKKAANLSN
jgi:hypothetical protein